MQEQTSAILQLPVSVVGKVDIGRLIREVQALDNFLEAAAVREPGTALKLPKTSRLMDEVIQVNQLNPLVDADRLRLTEFLNSVRGEAPVLHISFSADPSPMFAQRIITWLRQEIHPLVLLQVGLQPSIGAGAIVRSTNKYFDFSLRERFTEKRQVLIHKLRTMDMTTVSPPVTALSASEPEAAVTPAAAVPEQPAKQVPMLTAEPAPAQPQPSTTAEAPPDPAPAKESKTISVQIHEGDTA